MLKSGTPLLVVALLSVLLGIFTLSISEVTIGWILVLAAVFIAVVATSIRGQGI